MNKIRLKEVESPMKDCTLKMIALTEETIKERLNRVKTAMLLHSIDQLVIYGDVEHCSNFEYLTGYFPRFEEGLLIVNSDGTAKLVLGNENLNKASKARIQADAIHASQFSLPHQPQYNNKSFVQLLLDAGIKRGKCIGVAGWKVFANRLDDNEYMYDIPHYIVEAIKHIAGTSGSIQNATALFIGEHGVRTINNANEIAYYEFGASLASDCILDAMNAVDVGVSEMLVADKLVRYGQHTSVVTIAASGERYVKANMFPSQKQIQLGDPMSLTVGYRGGLSSRAGYAVANASQLETGKQDYLDRVAKPYFIAYLHWLKTIRIGMTGGFLYDEIDRVFPKQIYGWTLCPGHLTGEDEWMASPIYEGSTVKLKSGNILQIDIIPAIAGYAGVSAESTVVLADEALKNGIRNSYPELWERMQRRIRYMREHLGVKLSDEVLPMCSTVGYIRPFMLAKNFALVCDNCEYES